MVKILFPDGEVATCKNELSRLHILKQAIVPAGFTLDLKSFKDSFRGYAVKLNPTKAEIKEYRADLLERVIKEPAIADHAIIYILSTLEPEENSVMAFRELLDMKAKGDYKGLIRIMVARENSQDFLRKAIRSYGVRYPKIRDYANGCLSGKITSLMASLRGH